MKTGAAVGFGHEQGSSAPGENSIRKMEELKPDCKGS